jgi:serine/threonine-protein kinase
VQAIVAKVMSSEPVPLASLRKSVPAHVAEAVHTALEKLPADRCASAKAFADALSEGRATHATSASHDTHASAYTRARSRGAGWVSYAGWAVALIAVAAAATLGLRGERSVPAPVVPLTLDTPNARPELARFAVSGDGMRFAFTTDEGIAYREAGQREYRLLPGTENGESPSFSPDGEWIVFQAGGTLAKIAVAGGSPAPLFPTDSLLVGRVSWGENGSIVFETGSVLAVLPPRGPLRMLRKATAAEQPRLTPDGRGVLYVDNRQRAKLMYYDLALDTAFTVLTDAAEAQLLPTGHLLFGASTGGLYTIRFDQARRAVEGAPSPVVLDMQSDGGVAPFVLTRNGTLVYRAGVDAQHRVLMREADGKVDTLPLAPKVISYARFSPDGRKLAFTFGSARGTNRHTWLYDIDGGTLTRFTTEGGGHAPVWSRDGTRIAFTAEVATTDAEDLFVQDVERRTPPARVVRMPSDQHASDWPADTMLVFSNLSAARTLGTRDGRGQALVVNPVTKAAPRVYLGATWGEYDAIVSPDGQWAAYTSFESGGSEIQVRRFPIADAGGRWKVSSAGGQRARWSADGRTIIYQSADATEIRAVAVTPGSPFVVGATRTLLKVSQMGSGWDVDRTTGRIVVTEPVEAPGVRIVVMQHWLDQFRRGAGK